MADTVTNLLKRWGAGDRLAEDELFSRIYLDLRRMAAHHMRKEGSADSLQPTALVHEVYLRLANINGVEWQNRGHFFALASRVMRRLLVDQARARQAVKRGAGVQEVPLTNGLAAAVSGDSELLAVHEALDRLAVADPRQGQVVEMRYFGGLSFEETAGALGVSARTVKRDWTLARMWLHREIVGSEA